MANDRDELQAELEDLLGSENVYFQPPESKKISYPCIVYELSRIETRKADNAIYKFNKRWTITYITKKAYTSFPEKILSHFQMSSYDRHYVSDNLHHDVITVYY